MTYRILFLLFFLLIGLCLAAQQPVKRAKQRAKHRTENRANQRIDQKVDEGVDKAFGAIEGLFKKKQAPAAAPVDTVAEEAYVQSVLYGTALEEGEFEAYQNPTAFSLRMLITERKKSGKENRSTIQLGAIPDRFAMLVTDEDGRQSQMILNTQDGKTTTITTNKKGQKEGFRMRIPNLGSKVDGVRDEMADYITITRTGERKTIDGYACEKYLVEDSKHGTTTTSWVTQDLALTPEDVFGGMVGMMGAGKQLFRTPEGGMQSFDGFPIQSTTRNGKTETEMYFTDIRVGEGSVDRSLFDTEGVTIQEISFGG
ncbi:hypothetical protein LEM8419_03275 [Neolewinella maritima]|uniref:DUF4412 domain-containing protein n=1 Tax=Neolewinella maritima TaxID=1383882 RepID=A0ABM9B4U6_9BACT|nr:DUF4412 domain-containing protein [Neolewinella maritima]CAH1002368.1 hypothetical protein LEM8419_03275 [Neolewinella maritima]